MALFLLFQILPSVVGLHGDVFSKSFKDVLASDVHMNPKEEISSRLRCNFRPTLLAEGPLPSPRTGQELSASGGNDKPLSIQQQWVDFYARRWRRFVVGEAGGVVLHEVGGECFFRVQRATGTDLRNGNMVFSQGWNRSSSVPTVGGALSMGGALVWAPPPANRSRMACQRKIGRGRLLVLANWFPGNYGHFMHDSLPVRLIKYLTLKNKSILKQCSLRSPNRYCYFCDASSWAARFDSASSTTGCTGLLCAGSTQS